MSRASLYSLPFARHVSRFDSSLIYLIPVNHQEGLVAGTFYLHRISLKTKIVVFFDRNDIIIIYVYFTYSNFYLLDLVDEIAEENAFSFEFQSGDIQFANNYVIWHGREAHTPAKGEHDTRHLMRIWTYVDNFRTLADDEVIRYSCLKYGSRGRYAEDVLKDVVIQTHPRGTNA